MLMSKLRDFPTVNTSNLESVAFVALQFFQKKSTDSTLQENKKNTVPK